MPSRVPGIWVLIIIILLGNIPVFIITPKLTEASFMTKMIMISLATTDILLAVMHLTQLSYFAIQGRYYFTEEDFIYCKIQGIMLSLAGVSVTNVALLCVDRVLTIKYPFKYLLRVTKTVAVTIEILIWVVLFSSSCISVTLLNEKIVFY